MKKIISQVNNYFIADPDEEVSLSDALTFYGVNGGLIVVFTTYMVLNITF